MGYIVTGDLRTRIKGDGSLMDSLRTRIARILYSQNADVDWNGNEMTWEEISQAYRECWLHDADVLIRELKLTPEFKDDPYPNWRPRLGTLHRYVTEWTADE